MEYHKTNIIFLQIVLKKERIFLRFRGTHKIMQIMLVWDFRVAIYLYDGSHCAAPLQSEHKCLFIILTIIKLFNKIFNRRTLSYVKVNDITITGTDYHHHRPNITE